MSLMRCLAVLALLFATPLPAYAQSFDDAVAAYDAGEYQKAHAIWRELARAGDPAAMRNLGHLFHRGLGVPRAPKQALKHYKDAAYLGVVGAKANVGQMYLNGEAGKVDYKEAAYWLEAAAKGGHIGAAYLYGVMFEKGLGRPANIQTAYHWYTVAGRGGHDEAVQQALLLLDQLPSPTLPPLAERPAGAATPTEADTSKQTQSFPVFVGKPR